MMSWTFQFAKQAAPAAAAAPPPVAVAAPPVENFLLKFPIFFLYFEYINSYFPIF